MTFPQRWWPRETSHGVSLLTGVEKQPARVGKTLGMSSDSEVGGGVDAWHVQLAVPSGIWLVLRNL